MVKVEKKIVPIGYYRPTNINPNWYNTWTEQISEGNDAEDVLDQLCHIACGIEIGAVDQLQRNAKHIHACLIAAYKVGIRKATTTPQ